MRTSKIFSLVAASALIVSAVPAALAAPTSVIFTDGFEGLTQAQVDAVNGSSNGGSGWAVFDQVGDWSAGDGDAGIEVQEDGRVVAAADGDYYVELDSHSNSSMTRDLGFLVAGDYQLTWNYQPRNNRENDNRIDVSVSGGVAITPDSANDVTSDYTGWREITSLFTLSSAGTYALTFSAGGIDNSLGGFIDLVTLSGPAQQFRPNAVPLPAAAWLFLSAIGAGGLLRRAKRNA